MHGCAFKDVKKRIVMIQVSAIYDLHPFVEVTPFSCFERITCSRILGGSVRCCVLLVFWNSFFSKINDLPCVSTRPLCT